MAFGLGPIGRMGAPSPRPALGMPGIKSGSMPGLQRGAMMPKLTDGGTKDYEGLVRDKILASLKPKMK